MNNDIVFKTTAFGGFRKADVMEYINSLIFEKSESDSKLYELSSVNNKLNQRIHDLEFQLSSSEELKSVNADLKAEIDSMKQEILKVEELEASVNELKKSLSEAKMQNEALRAELSASNENTPDIDALIKENNSLKAEIENVRSKETQVGAAMLDARMHSDELLKEAKVKADIATKEVYDAIGDTALRIDSLSSDISDIARSFTKAAEEVELRINVLTGNMSKTAQALLSDNLNTSGSICGEVNKKEDY